MVNSMTDKLKSNGKMLIDTECIWQKQTVSEIHILSVKNTDCLWQTQTGCDRDRFLDRHNLSVTDIDCM